jgi:hypothetical protein
MAQRPVAQGPMTQGPMTQGPMAQGTAVQGPMVQGTAVRGFVISADSWWMLGGGAAVVLGSVLPWVSATVSDSTLGAGIAGLTYQINGGARAVSAVFGVILIGLGFAMQSKSARGSFVKPGAYGYAVPFIVLTVLGVIGFALFTLAGIVGFTEDDGLGGSYKVTFSPSVGLILLLVGCVVAFIGGIKAIRHAPRR